MNIIQSETFGRFLDAVRNMYNRFEDKITAIHRSRGKKTLLWGVVILIIFSILLALNIFTPMMSDDYSYSFIFPFFDTRTSSLIDVVRSQANHYHLWGGRTVVHFIAQWLLLLPPLVIDVLNAAVFLVYIYLVYIFVRGWRENSVSLFLLVFLGVWFLQPIIGDTVLWLTGAANYLWGTAIVLAFLLPYRFCRGVPGKPLFRLLASIGLFLFGIVAGWTNENSAGAMIFMVILFFVYYRSYKLKIPVWLIAGLAGAVIGYCLMILAPGNFMRGGEAISFSPFIILFRLFKNTEAFLQYCGVFTIAYLVFIILLRRFTRSNKQADPLKMSFIFCAGTLAGVYAMVVAPSFPPRAWFGVISFYLIAAGIVFYNLDFRIQFIRQIKYAALCVGLLCFVFTLYTATKETYTFYKITEEREALIEQAKASGASYCEFESYAGGRYVHPEDDYTQTQLSKYYGIEIRFKDK